MRTHGAVVGRRFRSVTKLTTKVRIGRGYLWGSFLIAAAALKTPTRNGYNAQGVNLNFRAQPRKLLRLIISLSADNLERLGVSLREQSRIEYSLLSLDSVNPGFIWRASLVNPLDSFGFTYRDSYNGPKRI